MFQKNEVNKAENDVDRIVRDRFFPDTKTGIFVDVGAARPDFLSVSSLFRSGGWRIIAIEPNPAFCDLHREMGYEVLQFACGDRDEDNVDFSIVDSHNAIYEEGKVSYESFSSLGIKDSFAHLKDDLDITKTKVSLRRLDTLLTEYAPEIETIDILSIDVEGWELDVLNGLNVSKYKPRVMIIENLFNERKYGKYMAKLRYVLWRRIYPNDVYLRRDMLNTMEVYLKYVYQNLISCFTK
ncbi:MAG: FkbM family methyltransferase [Phycisphaerae bacterium]|nr:FkbM family methyltransferase [Phycisphaerae bacterium]